VIAHRLSTSERADRVGVVADGALVELGTHDDLVAAGGRYAALHATWVKGLATT
jgi:ABC-type multidrug transport system fused ATPase/permease subunit